MKDEKLSVKATVTKADDGFIAVASTDVEDRHGEIVEVSGWDLKNFKKNPVLLWSHDHNEPAIGIATRVWISRTKDSSERKLMIKAKFHDITEKARAVKQLFEEGILNSFSVGFRPLEMEDNRFTSQELLEVSAVNVPANAEAHRLAYKALKKDFNDEVISEFVNTDLVKLEQRMAMLEDKQATLVKALSSVNPNKGRTQAVVDSRIALTKVISRATDEMLKDKSNTKNRKLAKVIKRTNESLNRDLKGK